jgi:archaellum component FlaC
MKMSDKPGYLFQTSIQIGERMALTVSGNLPLDASAKEIENELDRIFDAMEKQELKRMKLPAIKGALQDQKDALERTEQRYEELAFQEQGRKLNQAEKAQQETCHKQISTLREQVSKGEEILAAMEKEAA